MIRKIIPVAIMVLAFTAVGCDQQHPQPTTMPEPLGSTAPRPHVHHRDAIGQGLTRMPGITIQWGGATSTGAQTLDVVNTAIVRVQFEQGTDEFASDTNARALAFLMLARQELEGKTTTTEDGLPILE